MSSSITMPAPATAASRSASALLMLKAPPGVKVTRSPSFSNGQSNTCPRVTE
jgi:hypothetical protein